MKILLVNNHTQHLSSLQKSLSGHSVEIQTYQPGLNFHVDGKDLVILSGGGGEGLEINDAYSPGKLWYDDEMRFVRACQVPLLGICMGFEVIARAYNAPVTATDELIHGFNKVEALPAGKSILAHSQLSQFEAHNWRVQDAPVGFEVLANSKTGIEAFAHQSRPIIATQFHPEKGGSLDLAQLVNRTFSPLRTV